MNYTRLSVLAIFIISIMASCSITKKIPDNSQLLVKNKIECDNRQVDTEDMKNYIRQKPNRKTLFMRYHLRLFYMFENSESKFGTKMRENVAEPPTLLDNELTERSVQQLKIYMQERGFYNSNISYNEKNIGLRKKKSVVTYFVQSGERYEISKLSLEIPDTAILSVVSKYISKQLQAKKTPFDIRVLKEEQQRLTREIRNAGYYAFEESNIYFAVDTSGGYKHVELTLSVKNNTQSNYETYKKSVVQNIYVYPDFDVERGSRRNVVYDTVKVDTGVYFLYRGEHYMYPEVVQRANYIHPNDYYSLHTTEKTQYQLSQNKLFKLVTITYSSASLPTDTLLENQFINCNIFISPRVPQSITAELEGTNTGGDWGAQANLLYMHRNLAKGSENFYIKTKAAREYYSALKSSDNSGKLFNAFEYGAEIGLETPVFLSPLKPEKFDYKYRPRTNIKLAYNFNKTIDYTKPTLQASYGYTWFGNSFLTHLFKPIELTYIEFYDKSDRLLRYIEQKKYIQYSFEDYMIFSTNYTYTHYNRQGTSKKNYHLLRMYAEAAGNLMYSGFKLLDLPAENGKYKTFGKHFAQFAKIEIDARYYQHLPNENMIVYRLFSGVAAPYLNSDGLPSVSKFFAGGANSMRAWANRSLGPGAYTDAQNEFTYYMGDIKFEANLEYRFPMFWYLRGALFADIGNIWTFNDNSMEQSAFNPKYFLQDLAVGTGCGLRFDFSFLVLRFDLGLKIKKPYRKDVIESIPIYMNKSLKSDDMNLTITIGYPF